LVVFADGRAGLNAEHSKLDGTTILDLVDAVLAGPAPGHTPHAARGAGVAAARPLTFVLDAPLRRVSIGAESNVQDNVRVFGTVPRRRAAQAAMAAAGLGRGSGVEIGERVILAHGSEVRGPARIGVDASEPKEDAAAGAGAASAGAASVQQTSAEQEAQDSGVFLSFGAQVDGAVIERDTALSALSRVGPGVRLRSGTVVLPGKSVTTQEQADDPTLGKVRRLLPTDVEFNAAVVEVNVGLAREYTRLAREDASAVRGINLDPGGNEFDQSRDAPSVESALCTGPQVREPDARNRVIGDVCFEDSLDDLDRKLGSSISIRADEGGPFAIGTIGQMDDRVVFHALEGSDLRVGERVEYGDRAIVHGGGRPQVDPTTGLAAATIVGNDVVLGSRSVVFRSLLRNGTVVGSKSAVVGSQTALDQVIPPRTIYANDTVFGPVEW
jgi:carbonic anhydrase/acetyltransferase-like protein (isoleucine patch superfamily)